MKVLIPSSLRSYTQRSEAEANGATLAAVLADLDRRYPGIRFRMIDEQDSGYGATSASSSTASRCATCRSRCARPTRW